MLENATIIDLTKPLNADLEIYRDGIYADPDFLVEPWCTVVNQGFAVSQLSLGTQTGTHIDAPSHFVSGGETLDDLPIEKLMGPYYLLDLGLLQGGESLEYLLSQYVNQQILFLTCPADGATITQQQLDSLCAFKIKVWVVSGQVRVIDEDAYHFHRSLAERGVYLIEDVDQEAAQRVTPKGELIALPLRLEEVSGSPCRVLTMTWTQRKPSNQPT